MSVMALAKILFPLLTNWKSSAKASSTLVAVKLLAVSCIDTPLASVEPGSPFSPFSPWIPWIPCSPVSPLSPCIPCSPLSPFSPLRVPAFNLAWNVSPSLKVIWLALPFSLVTYPLKSVTGTSFNVMNPASFVNCDIVVGISSVLA